jgi:hypothetical protein
VESIAAEIAVATVANGAAVTEVAIVVAETVASADRRSGQGTEHRSGQETDRRSGQETEGPTVAGIEEATAAANLPAQASRARRESHDGEPETARLFVFKSSSSSSS